MGKNSIAKMPQKIKRSQKKVEFILLSIKARIRGKVRIRAFGRIVFA